MALYEFFCPTCRSSFEERRPMTESHRPATCPQGHVAERRLSLFAVTRSGGIAVDEAPAAGGCCGGGACACASAN